MTRAGSSVDHRLQTIDRLGVSALASALLAGLLSGAISAGVTYATIAGQERAQSQQYLFDRQTKQRELRSKAYVDYLEALDTFYANAGVYRACARPRPVVVQQCAGANNNFTAKTVLLERARRQVLIYGSDRALNTLSALAPDTSAAPEINGLQAEVRQLQVTLDEAKKKQFAEAYGSRPGLGPRYQLYREQTDRLRARLDERQKRLAAFDATAVVRLRKGLLELICREGPAPREQC